MALRRITHLELLRLYGRVCSTRNFIKCREVCTSPDRSIVNNRRRDGLVCEAMEPVGASEGSTCTFYV